MSDVDPTPETPVTIGDRLGWWRGDVAARLTTLEAQVAALAGEPSSTLAALQSRLAAIEGQWSHGSGIRPYDLLDLMYQQQVAGWGYGSGITPYSLLDLMYEQVVELNQRLDRVQAAIGASPYESLELGSVRGLLNALLSGAQFFGLFPDLDPSQPLPVKADETATNEGNRYIIWPYVEGTFLADNPTLGLPLGAFIGPDTSWAGYKMFIRSDGPTYFVNGTEYPANSWRTMSGTSAKSVWVPSIYQASGYIQVPIPSTEQVYSGTSVVIAGANNYHRIPGPWLATEIFPGKLQGVGLTSWTPVEGYEFKVRILTGSSTLLQADLTTGLGSSSFSQNVWYQRLNRRYFTQASSPFTYEITVRAIEP